MEFRKINDINIDESRIKDIARKFSVTESVAELLLLRNFTTDEQIDKFLNPSLKDLHNPFLFNNMKAVVDKINNAMLNKKRILIFGDYDVDGITASYILIDYFKSIGYDVDAFLPNRYVDGYGLTMETANKVLEAFKPELIITVDCGISGYKEVDYLKSKGVDIIVTDHHDCPDILPDCLIIDAKVPGEKYPFKEMCGAGVALKLVMALSNLETAEKYLPVCAIATVSDIVPLLDENRAIVQIGLNKPLSDFPIGLTMLIKELKMAKPITSQEVSFKLAPKINAAGRMGDAQHSLDIYLEKDHTKLQKMINKLINYNTERQNICNMVYLDCIKKLKNINLANHKVIALANDNWNIGILGIVAARISEEFNRPTFLLGLEGEFYKGSCRSVAGINIHEVLTELKDLLTSFGGHTMAAGMTIEKNNFEKFVIEVEKIISLKYDDKVFVPYEEYDLDVDLKDINANYILGFEKLQPFGCQNPAPIFHFSFDKSTCNPMKTNPNHITIQLPSVNLILFNSPNYYNLISQSSEKECLAELHVDTFRNNKICKGIVKSIQLNSTPNISAERIGGEYIKQLSMSSFGLKAKYKIYNKNNLEELLLNQKSNYYGTLIITNTLQSYKNFVEKSSFKQYIICYEYLNLTNDNGYNTICICPNSANDYRNYNRIILLDSVLDEGYIVDLNKNTNATIYIPQNSPFLYAPFKSLDLSRKVFGNYFNILKIADKQKITAFDDFNYFNKLKRVNKNINYVQFVACVETFKQLGIIEVNNEIGNYKISVNSGITSKLEKSYFYNKLELIMKTY